MHLAKNMGFETPDLMMYSCRGKPAVDQANAMLEGIPSDLYNKVWIVVQPGREQSCDWSLYPGSSNCQYLKQLLAAVKGFGK